MPPKLNKRKRTSPAPQPVVHDPPAEEPIVFKSPGLVPDVRLRVFDTEFHVHSIILKLHSNYFRRFLDSADKPERPQDAPFRYEYITVIDDDGSWALEWSDTGCQPKFESDPSESSDEVLWCLAVSNMEVQCFTHLLCAFYSQPYYLDTPDELRITARLADFYCALPVLSATLTAAFMKGKLFGENGLIFMQESRDLIKLAKKLRNPALFRECFVHQVGQYERDSHIKDREIKKLIVREYNKTCDRIMRTQTKLILPISTNLIDIKRDMAEFLRCNVDPTRSPRLFRTLKWQVDSSSMIYEGPASYQLLRELSDALCQLMVNNLRLDRSGFGLGKSGEDDYFLCAQINDDEMPWDSTETDW
ncbi:hypothetical protein VTL71DRAFT_13531 [Oculimacula yallundae]|uniref:BTB domain-containing protein n=1 Tax=Oculimacula yallundae TaxID=86028 RepID=A0ABR4CKM3_9HELO